MQKKIKIMVMKVYQEDFTRITEPLKYFEVNIKTKNNGYLFYYWIDYLRPINYAENLECSV